MLYDILPPVILLGSVGGIIWIISRVVARIRRTELSVSINSAASEDSSVSTTKIQPKQFRIHLFENRRQWLSTLMQRIRQYLPVILVTVRKPVLWLAAWWKKRQERRVERLVTMEPAPVDTPPVTKPQFQAVEKPAISLRRVDPPRVQTGKQTTTPTFFKKKPKISVLEQAQQALSDAQYEQAEQILVPYIFSHTKDTAAYMLLGRVAVARMQWEEAVEIFEQVVKRDSKEPQAWALLGEAAYKSGHFTRALQALQRAHEADPTDIQVLENLLAIARKMDNRGLQASIREKLSALKVTDEVRV